MFRQAFLLFLLVVLPGCKRESVEPDEVHTVDLRLKFVFTYGTHDYELGSEYNDVTGRLYRVEDIRFLLSEFDVVDDFESVLADYGDRVLLVNAAATEESHPLGQLTAAHAHQTRFRIGLPAALNDADPSTAEAPLNDATMHWRSGSDEGYWFCILSGRMDTDNNGAIDDADGMFNYRCGTDALARTGWAIMHTELPDGGSFTVEVPVDVERLVAHLDLGAMPEALGGTALNVQLMDSLSACFSESH